MKNYIVCDCCGLKIIEGETYHVHDIVDGLSVKCTCCISTFVLDKQNIEYFWSRRNEDDYEDL